MHDHRGVCLLLKVYGSRKSRGLSVVKTLPNGCVRWSPSKARYSLRRFHHILPLRRLGWQKKKSDNSTNTLPYADVLVKAAGSEGISATVRRERVLLLGLRGMYGREAPAEERG